MNTHTKAAISVGFGFLALIAILYAAVQLIVLRGFARLEEQTTGRNIERARNALINQIANLDSVTADWAYWDDTYAFIDDVNPAYIEANLLDDVFVNLELNLMVYVNADRQIVFSKAYDLVNGQDVSLPEGFTTHLTDGHLFPSPADELNGKSGILLLPQGPMLVSVQPILTSAMEGPSRGTLIFGRFFDAAQVQHLSDLTQLQVAAYAWNAPDLPADFRTSEPTLSAHPMASVHALNGHTMVGYTLFTDIHGDPALIVGVRISRDIYKQGKTTIARFMAVVIAIAGLSSLVILALGDRLFLAQGRAEAILSSVGDALMVVTRDGWILQVNPAFEQQTGYSATEIKQQHYSVLFPLDTPRELLGTIGANLRAGHGWHGELAFRRKDNVVYDAVVTISLVRSRPGEPAAIVVSMQDITERKQMENQLRRSLEREMEIADMRSGFMSMASHDLRNPLAVIQSSTDLLLHYYEKMPEERKQATFNKIQRAIKTMVDLLDGVLTIGKSEAGLLQLNPQPLDLDVFCQTILDELQMVAGNGRTFAFSVHGQGESQMLDPKLLRHILTNLLSNAIKYSPVDCPVKLEVDSDGTCTVFRVADQGIGIPETAQQHVFQPFHRADNVGSVPGTGLGLAIVKQSVELHRGTIAFESQEGSGTTVTVTIPTVQGREPTSSISSMRA